MGYAYAGPPIGFVTKGRNLLFLRKTRDPKVWRVTIPVYATCIELADGAPDYELNGSAGSIRRALVKEFEAVIEQGRINTAGGTLFASPDKVAAVYLPYIWEILGRVQGTQEFKLLMTRSSGSLRQEIAMALLRQGDQAGEPGAIARLQDSTAVVWKRTNAAYALRNATSSRACEALENILNKPAPPELRHVAEESVSQMSR
jgi:HEAT repeat protein